MGDMTDLANRIEALDGPCRHIDLEIAVAVNHGGHFSEYSGWHWNAESELQCDGPGYLDGNRFCPKFSASIDAANTLVPEGYRTTVISSGPFLALVLWLHNGGRPFFQSYAKTEPLARTAAALRARQNNQGEMK